MFVTTKFPTMKTLMDGDDVHEDHDDHWSASDSEDCRVMCSSVFTMSLPPPFVGLCELILVSVVSPFCGRSDVNPFFHLLFGQILTCRIVCILVRARAFGTPRRSVLVFLCGTQVISCFLDVM